jgi:hypothetical protein
VTSRRLLLKGLIAGGALFIGSGHTPYGQWVVYRRRHLLIGCHRGDPLTYGLAKDAVALLDEHLPAASARVARAPNGRRLASLLGTSQMDVAVLDAVLAESMRAGRDAFAPYGEVPIACLLPVHERWLVAAESFPSRHAWLVTGALAGTGLSPMPSSELVPPIPWHPGALAFLVGEPEPTLAPSLANGD